LQEVQAVVVLTLAVQVAPVHMMVEHLQIPAVAAVVVQAAAVLVHPACHQRAQDQQLEVPEQAAV
jgi:hypothetical protein